MEMFINGEWVNGSVHYDVRNPATGEVVDEVPKGTSKGIDKAVRAARTAFKNYSTLPKEKRQGMMKEAAQRLKDISSDLAPLLTQEQGKPLDQAKGEIFYGGMVMDHFTDLFPETREIKNDDKCVI